MARKSMRLQPEIPIILTVGVSQGIDWDKIKQAGIKGLMIKPYNQEKLAVMVRKGIDNNLPTLN